VGFVAALCAAEYPDRVARLVLMGAMPPYHDPAWPAPAPLRSPDAVEAMERLRASGLEESDPAGPPLPGG
jgi:pimeloyl-ACP methyl ester carboxylesterase